jgi:2-amino-4-hydroxy-6-hydroxymethyldihydropteridine diphosphokinase
MALAWVGLGANLGGDPARLRATLVSAWRALALLPGTSVQATSSLWRSAPVEATGPDYLNAVVRLQTGLQPLPLLQALQAIEHDHGRQRPYRNAPRTLDLDLLWHEAAWTSTPALTLPHPRMHQRAFVLRPLLEIDPGLKVPGLGPMQDHLPAVAAQVLERCVTAVDWPPC